MTNSTSIQQSYIYLYECLRDYLWDMSAINDIVDLELAAYQAIPDIEEVKRKLQMLKVDCRNVLSQDEELNKAFDEFENLLNEDVTTYVKLTAVEEVVK